MCLFSLGKGGEGSVYGSELVEVMGNDTNAFCRRFGANSGSVSSGKGGSLGGGGSAGGAGGSAGGVGGRRSRSNSLGSTGINAYGDKWRGRALTREVPTGGVCVCGGGNGGGRVVVAYASANKKTDPTRDGRIHLWGKERADVCVYLCPTESHVCCVCVFDCF